MVEMTLTTDFEQGDLFKVACLVVAGGHYALDITLIREIIRPLPLVPVPRAPAFIDGVITLRKAVIPVVDLRRRFALPPAGEDLPGRRVVICALSGRIVGLQVDDVSEICSCSWEDVRPIPYYLTGAATDLFAGVCRQEQKMMLLLDLQRLLLSSPPNQGSMDPNRSLLTGQIH